MWARIAPTTILCLASKRPCSASLSGGSFWRSLPLASSASTAGSVVPATSASSIARPEAPRMVGGDAVELDPGVLEDLVQPVGLPLTLADLRFPGRKTDVSDAAWLCQLLEAGLLRASFVPPKSIRTLRNLTRYWFASVPELQKRTSSTDGKRSHTAAASLPS